MLSNFVRRSVFANVRKCQQIYYSSSVKLPPEVDFNEFENFRHKKDIHILDVRNPDELKEVGFIPQTVNIRLDQLEKAFSMSANEFQKNYGINLPDKSDAIITFCRSGVRAGKAKALLEGKQYDNVSVYKGSFNDWNERMNPQ